MSAPSEEPKSQEEIIRRYQAMTAECAKLVEKVTELEVDRNEHRLVAENHCRRHEFLKVMLKVAKP